MRFAALGVTSAAEPPLLVSLGRLRVAAPPAGLQPVRLPIPPHPPSCAPVLQVRGLVGEQTRGGPGDRRTVSAAEKTTTHPQPLPVGKGLCSPSVATGGAGHRARAGSAAPCCMSIRAPWRSPRRRQLTMAFVRIERRNAHLALSARTSSRLEHTAPPR